MFGVGEVLGASGMGFYIDRNDSRSAAGVNLLIMIATITITLLTIYLGRVDFLMYFMGGFWGLQDGAMNVHVMQALGFEFDQHVNGEPFGVFNLVQGIAAFIVGMIQGQLKTGNGDDLQFYFVFIGLFGIISCVLARSFPYKYIKKNSKKSKKRKMLTRNEFLRGDQRPHELSQGSYGPVGALDQFVTEGTSEVVYSNQGSSVLRQFNAEDHFNSA